MDIISEYYSPWKIKLLWPGVFLKVRGRGSLGSGSRERCPAPVPGAARAHRLSVWCLLPFPPSIKNRRVTKNRLAGPHVTARALSYAPAVPSFRSAFCSIIKTTTCNYGQREINVSLHRTWDILINTQRYMSVYLWPRCNTSFIINMH